MVEKVTIHSEEERKKLNENGWISSVKLSRMPEIGWTITWMAMDIKSRKDILYYGPENVLKVKNSPSACGVKYYYRKEEIIPAMKAFNEMFHESPKIQQVRDFWKNYNA